MKSILHTVGAILVALLVFLLIISTVVPVVDAILTFFGKWFVPARFGGGDEVDNPGLLTALFRTFMYSAAATYGAWLAAASLFKSHASGKIVATVIGVVAIGWASILYFLAFNSSAGWFAKIVILTGATAGAAPPIIACYWVWKEGWR